MADTRTRVHDLLSGTLDGLTLDQIAGRIVDDADLTYQLDGLDDPIEYAAAFEQLARRELQGLDEPITTAVVAMGFAGELTAAIRDGQAVMYLAPIVAEGDA